MIFLGGAPRSGTTLLQNMLDTHPEILGGPEFLHIPDIIGLRNKLQASVGRGWISLICSAGEVDERIRGLISGFLLTFADRHGAKFLSEKTPENVLVFPRLIELFPDSRFIHVVRDPRATVASLLEVGNRARRKGEQPAPFTASAHAAIQHVRRCLEAGFSASNAAPGQVYTVVYEKLVRDPEREGRDLCRYLGVEWFPEMTRPGEKKHLGESAITVNSKEIWYDARTYNSNPNPASLEKWRTTLSPYQQIMIARAFSESDDLKRLGYDLSLSDLNPAIRLGGGFVIALSGLRSRIRARVRR